MTSADSRSSRRSAPRCWAARTNRIRRGRRRDQRAGRPRRAGGELRAALADVRAAGKQLACHAEVAANAQYLVLAACEQIGVAPLGEIVISGPAVMPVHLKGLLAKLGVEADFLHVGDYKGAAEPLTRDAPSPQMRETLEAILDRAYARLVETVAADRKRNGDPGWLVLGRGMHDLLLLELGWRARDQAEM